MSWRSIVLLVLVALAWWRVLRAVRAAEPDSLLGRRISWPLNKSQIGAIIGAIAMAVGYVVIVTSSGLPRFGLPLGIVLFLGGLALAGTVWRGRPA